MKRAGDPSDFPLPLGGEDAGNGTIGAATAATEGVPLPLLWGTAKVPAILIEAKAPFEQTGILAWSATTGYSAGNLVTNGGNVYLCKTSGTSAGSGGPTGTDSSVDVPDGSCVWNFYCTATSSGSIWLQEFVVALVEGDSAGGEGLLTIFWDKQNFSITGKPLFYADGTQTSAGGTGDSTGYPHTIQIYTSAGGPFLPTTGSQRELPAIAAILKCARNGAGGGDVYDCKPSDIVNELLTHTRRGCGWSSSMVDDSITGAANNSFKTYCEAAGIRITLLVRDRKPASEILNDVLTVTNSSAFWSGGTLRIVPNSDQPIASPAYGSTPYVPAANSFALTYLSAGHFLDETEPVRVTRRPDADCFNAVPVRYFDRGHLYAETSAEDAEQADVALRGVVRAPVLTLAATFNDGTIPVMLSRIAAQRSTYVRNTYTWRCAWNVGLRLNLCDVGTLTEPEMGLNATRVRITEITEAEDGTFEVTAEEYPDGANAAASYVPQAFDGLDWNVPSTLSML